MLCKIQQTLWKILEMCNKNTLVFWEDLGKIVDGCWIYMFFVWQKIPNTLFAFVGAEEEAYKFRSRNYSI